ncbi:hypothetical protein A3752_16690 [Oleiphilus sp. HI0081]|nr:hypothetical protein A3743_06300 [Oleiphilus sp. HI0072]KZZ08767.1 hypothetical protein A3749_14180 [Oleiphilus sp. HI0078]KZZ18649.1 hypothetical protein A3752_16690 [Oleiphilus sp. HI0081]
MIKKDCTNGNQFTEKPKSEKNNKPYWILQRKIPRPSDSYARNIVGECSASGLEEMSVDEIVSRCLKDSCCFENDFNLLPKDRLDIVLSNKTYSLEFGNNGWRQLGKMI